MYTDMRAAQPNIKAQNKYQLKDGQVGELNL